jgi:molybdenum cofactor cytidylyltransferase
MIPEGRERTRPRRAHWCVVLAAGGSRRLGRPKQFVRLRGVPLIVAAVDRALATRPQGIVVVAGAHGSRLAAALRGRAVEIVRNRDWRLGLASSLRAGLRRVPASARSCVVTTVDQWRVTSADLERLLRAGAPAAAAYDGVLGVPAVLPRAWRARVLALRGDVGARALFGAGGVHEVAIPSATFDLDTPRDLAALRASASSPKRVRASP